jgi:helicase
MEAALLINADASLDSFRASLTTILRDAKKEDLVVVTFSGHGTHDHRLVLYDTEKLNLTATTLHMQEIADLFRESPARIVLCVLDCCFSGSAPGRVLEDSPVVKDLAVPLEILAGKGRILIAASKLDQVAFESPVTRHGLLTKALIDVLQAKEDLVNLTSAMASVMDHVRGAAARMGVTQTPVMIGEIEGGLTLPSLHPGTRFRKFFPEIRRLRIQGDFRELAAFGLPDTILHQWSQRFSSGPNQLQLSAINDFGLLEGNSLLAIAPTSSGKTFIGELAAARAITEGRKAVFLLPFKALTNEKFDDFTALYSDTLKLRVIRCTGDYADQVDPFVRGRYDLALLTYEMFLNLAIGNAGILNQIGLVVIDEAQFIADPHRGINLELLLTYLVASRARGIQPQLVALSAVIGKSNKFEEWLDCEKLVTEVRPVPLVEGVLDRSGLLQFVDTDGSEKLEQLLPVGTIRVRREKPGMQDIIVPLIAHLLSRDNTEKILVFRNQRGPAEGCAQYLARDLGLPPAEGVIAILPDVDLSSTSESLRRCLGGGTAFHNTNLTREERVVVERAFRDSLSPVRVLAATTTLAAGINTPASTVILAEQQFVGEDGRPFTVAEYKNMAGRAGRLGFNERGKAMILANHGGERQFLFARYVKGHPEDLASSFRTEEIETWVVRLLAQLRTRINRGDLVQLLLGTYGGYLANLQQPGWGEGMQRRLEALVDEMIGLGLVDEERGRLQLTMLGRACGQSSLSLNSAIRLVELLRGVGPRLGPEQLMALVQALPEADNGYTPVLRKGTKEALRIQQARNLVGSQVVTLLQRHTSDQYEYWGRCKRAAILSDWINGVSVEHIEETYSTTPFQGRIGYGDIRKFADNTRFHLRAAQQVAVAVFPEYADGGDATDLLLRRLEVGLPTAALDLLNIPISLTRGQYLALFTRGIAGRETLWRLSDNELREILGEATARRLARARPASVF